MRKYEAPRFQTPREVAKLLHRALCGDPALHELFEWAQNVCALHAKSCIFRLPYAPRDWVGTHGTTYDN